MRHRPNPRAGDAVTPSRPGAESGGNASFERKEAVEMCQIRHSLTSLYAPSAVNAPQSQQNSAISHLWIILLLATMRDCARRPSSGVISVLSG
jgi:hypothetical protein